MADTEMVGYRALVTGGGTGLGAATAKALAAAGCRVAVAGRRPGPIALVADEIGGLAIPCDVSLPAAVDAMTAQVADAFGGLDILVANVGGGGRGGTATQTTEDQWQETISQNLGSAFACARAALPHLVASGRGSAIFVSSISSLFGGDPVAYCAAKAGVNGLVRSIAADYGQQGVRANAVCPGTIDTGVHDAGDAERDPRTPLGRMGIPEEIGQACLFLAGPRASYITGVTFPVDGGASVVDVGLLYRQD